MFIFDAAVIRTTATDLQRVSRRYSATLEAEAAQASYDDRVQEALGADHPRLQRPRDQVDQIPLRLFEKWV